MENVNVYPEIISEILSWVPADSVLFQCTRVCKTWRTLILNPYFANLHCRRQLQLLNQQQQQLDDDDDDSGGGGGGKVGAGFLFWVSGSGILQLYYGGEEYYINDDEIDVIDEQQPVSSCKNKLLPTRIHHPTIGRRQEYRNSVVGSCNGLICLSVRHHDIEDPVYIFNPITREYLHLPRFTLRIYQDCIVSGFGYLPSTNQYKVVRIWYDPFNEVIPVGHIQVYTIGDGRGWRNTGETPFDLTIGLPGIPLNGALHWMDNMQRKLVAFDLADEEFRLYPAPPCVHPLGENRFINFYELRELGRRLCVVHRDVRSETVDIWSLKKKKKISINYDMELEQEDCYHSRNWTREFSITWKGLSMEKNERFRPFALTKNGEVLLKWCLNSKILSLYDPKTATIKRHVNDTGLKFVDAIPHMNSFVSLKALGENSKIIRRSRRSRRR